MPECEKEDFTRIIHLLWPYNLAYTGISPENKICTLIPKVSANFEALSVGISEHDKKSADFYDDSD